MRCASAGTKNSHDAVVFAFGLELYRLRVRDVRLERIVKDVELYFTLLLEHGIFARNEGTG